MAEAVQGSWYYTVPHLPSDRERKMKDRDVTAWKPVRPGKTNLRPKKIRPGEVHMDDHELSDCQFVLFIHDLSGWILTTKIEPSISVAKQNIC